MNNRGWITAVFSPFRFGAFFGLTVEASAKRSPSANPTRHRLPIVSTLLREANRLFSRDVIDLAMMSPSLPLRRKAQGAYGETIARSRTRHQAFAKSSGLAGALHAGCFLA